MGHDSLVNIIERVVAIEKNKKTGHNKTWTLKSRYWAQGPGERQSQK